MCAVSTGVLFLLVFLEFASPPLCCCSVVWPFLSHLSFSHTVGPLWLWIKHKFFISLSGWNKTSLSLDASEEHDGYSSAEDPLHSDGEDDAGKKLVCVCPCWWSSLNVCSLQFLSALISVLANTQWRLTMRRPAQRISWWRVGRRWSWSSRRTVDSGEKTHLQGIKTDILAAFVH